LQYCTRRQLIRLLIASVLSENDLHLLIPAISDSPHVPEIWFTG